MRRAGSRGRKGAVHRAVTARDPAGHGVNRMRSPNLAGNLQADCGKRCGSGSRLAVAFDVATGQR